MSLPSSSSHHQIGGSEYDLAWDDPLPHALSPTKHYLSRLRKGVTKAVVIFMHGRGDNIDDMVAVFLPTMMRRYGGVDGQVKNEGEYDENAGEACPVGVIGIEARDNVWYPESHNAETESLVKNNHPYQYSALDKIRQTILQIHQDTGLQPESVIFVGFSQGAILGNTYLHLGLQEIQDQDRKEMSIPLPGHILALAGSLFKVSPSFQRGFASPEEEKRYAESEASDLVNALQKLRQPSKVTNRLLAGTADRFFPQSEFEQAASTLAGEDVKDTIDVRISLGMEQGAPHIITARMIAATMEAIDAVLASG